MTAKKELNIWLEQLGKTKNEADRKKYVQSIEESILSKNTEDLREGLSALKESLADFNTEVDNKIIPSKIEVYPSSAEEIELLKSLFSKMNIRFNLT